MFTDTYLSSFDKEILGSFCQKFPAFILPVPAQLASSERDLGGGIVIPFREEIGDPSSFYACVRTEGPIERPDGVNTCEEGVGRLLVGTWL